MELRVVLEDKKIGSTHASIQFVNHDDRTVFLEDLLDLAELVSDLGSFAAPTVLFGTRAPTKLHKNERGARDGAGASAPRSGRVVGAQSGCDKRDDPSNHERG